ncbi:MAG: hypothetical protein IPI86_03140 [Anaerolineales bacterium]|nr:hypothetical protein [Anaerolineales bacterium]
MPNVFLLYGNDEFAITRKLKDFESDFTDPTTADMNTTRLEARTMTENDLNNAVNAMPFLASKRLVFIAGPSGKFNNPSTRKKFLEFLEKAPDTAKLVIYESIEPKEVEKHWLMKWADKNKPAGKNANLFPPQAKRYARLDHQRSEESGRADRSACCGTAGRDGRRGYPSGGDGTLQIAGVCQLGQTHSRVGCGSGLYRHVPAKCF